MSCWRLALIRHDSGIGEHANLVCAPFCSGIEHSKPEWSVDGICKQCAESCSLKSILAIIPLDTSLLFDEAGTASQRIYWTMLTVPNMHALRLHRFTTETNCAAAENISFCYKIIRIPAILLFPHTYTRALNAQPLYGPGGLSPLMSSSAGRSSLIIFCLLLAWHVQTQNCYYPDGTVEPTHIACNASAEHSLCCGPGSSCLTNSLCLSQWDTSINTGTCTDRNWTDPSCFQQCPPSLENDHGIHTLYRCNNDYWCCSTGGNTTSCCDDGNIDFITLKNIGQVMGGTGFVAGFTIAAVALLQTSASIAASSALSTPSALSSAATSTITAASSTLSTPNAIASTPATPQSPETSGNVTEADIPHSGNTASGSDVTKTGLGAGLGVGLPLSTVLITALLLLRRMRRHGDVQGAMSTRETAVLVTDGAILLRNEPREMESLPSEMPNGRHEVTQELEG